MPRFVTPPRRASLLAAGFVLALAGDAGSARAYTVYVSNEKDNTLSVIDSQTLTVTKTGNGTGSVSSVPSGIDCGGACSADYGYGSPVTLTASADGDSSFVGWSGAGCSGPGICVVSILSPVYLAELDWVDSALAAYGWGDESFRAAFSALLGMYEPAGTLPVRLAAPPGE